jgi:dipeptidyl aminopeptidase/acylaminoacyl peptidase
MIKEICNWIGRIAKIWSGSVIGLWPQMRSAAGILRVGVGALVSAACGWLDGAVGLVPTRRWPDPWRLVQDVAVLWRSLGGIAPLSAVLADGCRAELSYPDRREVRAWPSFDLLGITPAGPAEQAGGGLAGQIVRVLGGAVGAVCAGPSGLVAASWTRESYPPWYRVVIWSGSCRAMTPESVRVWGDPHWSPTGELAVAAFDGIRRGVVLVDPRDGATRWWSRPSSVSYRLLAVGPGGADAAAIRSGADGAAWLVRARPDGADQQLQLLRPGDETTVSVVRWAHDGITLEGLLALPPGPGPHAMLVFLHGGPVAGLACGEHPDPSAWVSSGLAVFMPDFRSSGIGGRRRMRQAFGRRELPADDPEAGDVLTGVDLLTARGVADPAGLFLFGHSYGGYLAGRIVSRDHRFRAAVCCEAVADLRLLDPVSRRMQADWLGGDPGRMPQRWEAASPAGNARHVRTPVLLIYAETGNLTAQGQAWSRALTSVGAENKLIMVPGADHTFSSGPARQRLTQAVAEWLGRHR